MCCRARRQRRERHSAREQRRGSGSWRRAVCAHRFGAGVVRARMCSRRRRVKHFLEKSRADRVYSGGQSTKLVKQNNNTMVDTRLALRCRTYAETVREFTVTMAASEAAASLPCDSEGPGARGRSTVTTAVATTCALLAVAAGAWMLWWPVPVDMYGWPALVTALVLMVCVQSRRLLERHDTVVEESLLVIGEVGVQLRTIYAGGHARTQFIDRAYAKWRAYCL